MCCLVWILRVYSIYVVISLLLIFGRCQSLAQRTSVLPGPSGNYAIGRQSFYLTDASRTDQFSPAPAHRRELMIHLWYCAQRVKTSQASPYLPDAKKLDQDAAARSAMRQGFDSRWPSIVSGSVESRATPGAPAMHGVFPGALFAWAHEYFFLLHCAD
jgi:hypothetical protein